MLLSAEETSPPDDFLSWRGSRKVLGAHGIAPDQGELLGWGWTWGVPVSSQDFVATFSTSLVPALLF